MSLLYSKTMWASGGVFINRLYFYINFFALI